MAKGKTRTTSEDDGVTLPPVDAEALKAKAWKMYERVVEAYGHQPNVPRREPMHELISTILSHRTTGKNEDVAYDRMRSRWKTWEEVRDAPTAELAEAIAPSNFADQKAPRIQAVLRRIIEERGEADIDFLRDMPLTDAMAWLTDLPGVGPKDGDPGVAVLFRPSGVAGRYTCASRVATRRVDRAQSRSNRRSSVAAGIVPRRSADFV